ncbi:ABC transporter, partial [Streptomyces sp. NPDC058108]
DTAGIQADELTLHTPDLDDVFFALTPQHTHTTPHTDTAPQTGRAHDTKDTVR